MLFLIATVIFVVYSTLALVKANAIKAKAFDSIKEKNDAISSLEEEIAELKKLKDDRAQLHSEIYKLQKENISLMKKI